MPVSRSEFVEGHAVMAAGYDDHTQLLTFMNSWGQSWGDRGSGYLPYQYFDTYVSDAWARYPGKTKNWRPTTILKPFISSETTFINWLGNPEALIDLWQVEQDIRIGWCLMTFRGDEFLEIEDFFIRPDFQLDNSHATVLTSKVLDFSHEQELPLKLWIAHADTRHYAANFKPINDFVRATNLKMRPSPFSWAAYVAE
jgi:hypothetical protein